MLRLPIILLMVWFECPSFAGGSGLNVLVVVNPGSPNSLALGNYYCERRQVPPLNVVRMESWTGGNIAWTRGQFQSALLTPVLTQMAARGLGSQIDFVLLSMDIPYQVVEADSVNSTTAVLYYGFKPNTAPVQDPNSCSLPIFSSNSYAFSEAVFRDSPPDTAPAYSFLAMMLTADNLAQATVTVDQGVSSDGSFPMGPVYLANTSDNLRTVREVLFNDAILDTQIQGRTMLIATNQDSPLGLSGLLGYQTGLAQFNISPNTFVPGAMADSLTSFGGILFQANYQSTLLAFLAAGATGSYGTVVEPCDLIEKFPSPRTYFYQARGFSLAESYYQSLQNPYQGLLVGEPLAAPFARPGTGSWSNLTPGAVLTGITNLVMRFDASDAGHPLQRVDLFVDGLFMQTLTNLPPISGNVVSVGLNGWPIEYQVPVNASLASVTAGLADTINLVSNLTKVTASAAGDRIALRSTDRQRTGAQLSIQTDNASGSGGLLSMYVMATRTNFVDSTAQAIGSFEISNTGLSPGECLNLEVIKTNGTSVTVTVTNDNLGGMAFDLVQGLVDQVNSNALLLNGDGISADVAASTNSSGQRTLFLQARAPGLGPSQIKAVLNSYPPDFWYLPITIKLEDNLSDTEPRDHLYVTVGATNLPLVFPLDSRVLPDGYHELTAVAYEGSHVRTQTAITQQVVISNSPLSVSLSTVIQTNWALESNLQLSVSANTNAVATVELFSTGGSLGVVSNQASASFSLLGSYLGAGLHPFYAIVTTTNGAQYRTATKWIRLVADESPFRLAINGLPPLLSWPSIPGRSYDVLTANTLAGVFQLRQTVTATNEHGSWMESVINLNSNAFYRVRSSQ